MKKIIFSLAAASIFLLSCNTGSASEPNTGIKEEAADVVSAPVDQEDAPGKPVNLTKQDFLDKVMNYEKNQTEGYMRAISLP
jgi:hypothetical protein